MDLRQSLARGIGLRRSALAQPRGVVAGAAKTKSKGFGSSQRDKSSSSLGRNDDEGRDKQVVREAAAAVSSRPKYRPIRPEEASKGKLDYVQVADWGDGDRSRLGDLRLVSHVPQYEGGESSAAAASGGGGDGPRPFHVQLANQLQMAEARGALAVAGPPPPPLAEWSFREGRYAQYLADQLEVHTALEAALLEATSRLTTPKQSGPHAPITLPTPAPPAPQTTAAAPAPAPAAAQPQQPPQPQPPPQCAFLALQHLAPGALALERSGALRQDLGALRDTAGHPAALEAAASAAAAATPAARTAPGRGTDRDREEYNRPAGPMARSYGQFLRRLGRVAGGGESEEERRGGALRLLAHAAVLHLAAQAAGVRVGAVATERLALLQRRAAATYHEYPEHVDDPRVTLAAALDAAAEHIRSPAARQAVFDEMPGAMQKTGLLMAALAHRD